ncbi:MAG: ABC transporter substrate-binding protein [Planctomycetota bacterium]|jgi:iron complex transport system substrate-binding protein
MRKFTILLLPIVIVAGFIVFSRYQKLINPLVGEDTVEPVLVSRQKSRDKTPLSDKPERIVSLAPNITEILFALGLDKKIVAVSSDSDYPAEAANKKKVGTFWQPSTEAIITSRPDLVITLSFEQQKSVAETLNRLGYQVLTLKIEKIEELRAAVKEVSITTGCKQAGDKLANDIESRLYDLQSKVESANKVKVLWVIQSEPLRAAGRNTFVNKLLELAGGENAVESTFQQYPPIGTEQLLTCSAEVIIQSAMGTRNIADQQRAAEKFWSRWTNLPAVKNNRIYVVDSDIVLRLGPRLPQGIEMITRCLHPDIFGTTSEAVD